MKKKNVANSSNKTNEKFENRKKTQLTEKTLEFLQFSKNAFGELVTNYIEERLQGLSGKMQFKMIQHLLHYVFNDAIRSTGNLDLDIRVMDIIEKLPLYCLIACRFAHPFGHEQSVISSETTGYAN